MRVVSHESTEGCLHFRLQNEYRYREQHPGLSHKVARLSSSCHALSLAGLTVLIRFVRVFEARTIDITLFKL